MGQTLKLILHVSFYFFNMTSKMFEITYVAHRLLNIPGLDGFSLFSIIDMCFVFVFVLSFCP